MNRRKFIKTGAAGLAASTLNQEAMAELINGKPKRVGLIGTGWYGKADLLRLIQVAPVDVVSLCDVDSSLLTEAAEIVAGSRQLRHLLFETTPQMLQPVGADRAVVRYGFDIAVFL